MVPQYWILFLWVFLFWSANSFDIGVQYNQGTQEVIIGGGAWTPVTQDNGATYVNYNGAKLQWFPVSNTGTPISTSNGSAVFTATNQFNLILIWDDLPFVFYQSGDASLGWLCTKVLQTGHQSFTCNSSNISAQFSAPSEDGLLIQTLNISAPNINTTDPSFSALLSLAIHRLTLSTSASAVINTIAQTNEDRLHAARPMVAAILFFVEMGLLCLSILTAVWQTWLWAGPSIIAKDDGCCKVRSFVVWTLIFLTVQQLVAWLGGFVGWIFIIVLQSVYAAIVTGLYMSLYCTCCNNCCTSAAKCMHCQKCADTLDDNFASDTDSEHIVNSTPAALTKFQRTGIIVFLSLTLVMGLIALLIFGTWTVRDYYVWDRNQLSSVVEFQPQQIARTVAIVYDYPGIAKKLQMNIFHKEQTVWCGQHYTEVLNGDDRKAIKTDWIDKYSIDMSMFARPDYTQYSSINDWFTRTLHPNDTISHRPLSSPTNEKVIVSPADARVVVFESVHPFTEVWIKGETLSVKQLLNANDTIGDQYTNGTMAIVRLAPQDYHNFHAPVSGKVLEIFFIAGTLYSVNADAMRSTNGAIYNQRVIVWVDTAGYGNFGKMAFVAIGAACVGSVVIGPRVGDIITKGDNIGFFQFGGSTNVIVFPPAVLTWDQDLLVHSRQSVESLVRVRQQIAIAN